MRHEISQKEADAIQRARATDADRRRELEREREREREQRELDEHQSAMELKYNTQ